MSQRVHRLERSQRIPRGRDEVFAFFADASNLEVITPPFLHFRILSPQPIEMRRGARIDYALSFGGVPLKWRTHVTEWEPGVCFVDEQEAGPYRFWRHTHHFEDRGSATMMRDVVEYAEPLGALGRLAHVLFIERALDRIFDFRRDAIERRFGPEASVDSPSSPLHPVSASTSRSHEVDHDRLRLRSLL
jgi:ligand-binding SRPBCC domain-containing protein